jgi:hypothetical protein
MNDQHQADAIPEQPGSDRRILEAIEVCRPGSNDLAEPALGFLAEKLATDASLRDLYERMQRVDARLAAAFRDVPVPERLAQRLLEHLAVGQTEQAASAPAGESARNVAGEPAGTERLRHVSKEYLTHAWRLRRRFAPENTTPRTLPSSATGTRRRLLIATAVTATAATLAVVAWIGLYPAPSYSESAIWNQATAYFQAESAQLQHAQPAGALIHRVSPPKGFPISRTVAQVPGIRWRSIHGFLGRDGVAYDLPGRGGRRATLYVIKPVAAQVPHQPPWRPGLTTGGFCASAWLENDRLYVLVVRGNSRTYQGCFVSPGPLT